MVLVLLAGCKKENKTFSIQAINLIHPQNKVFANSKYKIYDKKRRGGLKLIHEGTLNNDEIDYFNIKVNKRKSYYYKIETDLKFNSDYRYVIDLNNVPDYDDFTFNSAYLFDYNKNVIPFYYILKTDILFTINNVNCNGTDNFYLKFKYLEDHKDYDNLYGNSISKYGCVDNEVVHFRIDEGKYALEWSVINSDLGIDTTYYDTITLNYNDTTNYTINY